MSLLPAVFNQKPPSKHNLFVYGKNTTGEHGAHLVREPLTQFRSVCGISNSLDSEADFRKRNHADI